jgi:hypothetical protein
MKAWILLPLSAVALAIGLAAVPTAAVPTGAAQRTAVSAPVAISVQVATVERPEIMSDACVFSADAMAAGAPAQCGHAAMVQTVVVATHQPRNGALKWPGDFLDLTAAAAVEAWDVTLCFVDGLFGYARESTGLEI